MELTLPLTIYTDGSSSRKDERGGWAFVAVSEEVVVERYGSRSGASVTNNTMELLAVLNALRFCRSLPCDLPVRVLSDSQYVVNAVNVWMESWKRNGWLTSTGDPVANRRLLTAIDDQVYACRMNDRPVSLSWVRGHANVMGNERADELAKLARTRLSHGCRVTK